MLLNLFLNRHLRAVFNLRVLDIGLFSFGHGTANHLHHARHANIPMADSGGAPATRARHRELASDEVVSELAEKATIAPVVHGMARIEAARHARVTAKSTGVPDAHAPEPAGR